MTFEGHSKQAGFKRLPIALVPDFFSLRIGLGKTRSFGARGLSEVLGREGEGGEEGRMLLKTSSTLYVKKQKLKNQ